MSTTRPILFNSTILVAIDAGIDARIAADDDQKAISNKVASLCDELAREYNLTSIGIVWTSPQRMAISWVKDLQSNRNSITKDFSQLGATK